MAIKIRIKYLDGQNKLKKIKQGDWYDLSANENITLKKGDYYEIPLGVIMNLPANYEAHIVMRSSTFKKHGIIQTNGIGIIDNSYCGETDEWKLPVYATRNTQILAGERICQFRLFSRMNDIEFVKYKNVLKQSRGGFGSTDSESWIRINDYE